MMSVMVWLGAGDLEGRGGEGGGREWGRRGGGGGSGDLPSRMPLELVRCLSILTDFSYN